MSFIQLASPAKSRRSASLTLTIPDLHPRYTTISQKVQITPFPELGSTAALASLARRASKLYYFMRT